MTGLCWTRLAGFMTGPRLPCPSVKQSLREVRRSSPSGTQIQSALRHSPTSVLHILVEGLQELVVLLGLGKPTQHQLGTLTASQHRHHATHGPHLAQGAVSYT